MAFTAACVAFYLLILTAEYKIISAYFINEDGLAPPFRSGRYNKGDHIELYYETDLQWKDLFKISRWSSGLDTNAVAKRAESIEMYKYLTLPSCNDNSETVWKLKLKDDTDDPDYYFGTSLTVSEGHEKIRKRLGKNGVEYLQNHTQFCSTKPLTEREAKIFHEAVRKDWSLQLRMDGVPMNAKVGESYSCSSNETCKALVYTNRTLAIQYNVDRIVQVDLWNEPNSLVEVEAGTVLNFTLVVHWYRTNAAFQSRFDRYLGHNELMRKRCFDALRLINSLIVITVFIGIGSLVISKVFPNQRKQTKEGNEKMASLSTALSSPLFPKPTVKEESKIDQESTTMRQYPSVLIAALFGAGCTNVVLLCVGLRLLKEIEQKETSAVASLLLVSFASGGYVAGFVAGALLSGWQQMRSGLGSFDPTVWVLVHLLLYQCIVFGQFPFLETAANNLPLGKVGTVLLMVLGDIVGLYGATFGCSGFRSHSASTCNHEITWEEEQQQPVLTSSTIILIGDPTTDEEQGYLVVGSSGRIAASPGGKSRMVMACALAGLCNSVCLFAEIHEVMWESLDVWRFYFVALSCPALTSTVTAYICLPYGLWTAFASGASSSVFVTLLYLCNVWNIEPLDPSAFPAAVGYGLICGVVGYTSAYVFLSTALRKQSNKNK